MYTLVACRLEQSIMGQKMCLAWSLSISQYESKMLICSSLFLQNYAKFLMTALYSFRPLQGLRPTRNCGCCGTLITFPKSHFFCSLRYCLKRSMAFGLISSFQPQPIVLYLRYVMLISKTRWRELVVDFILYPPSC